MKCLEGGTSFCCLVRSYHVVLALSSAKLCSFLLLDHFQSTDITGTRGIRILESFYSFSDSASSIHSCSGFVKYFGPFYPLSDFEGNILPNIK